MVWKKSNSRSVACLVSCVPEDLVESLLRMEPLLLRQGPILRKQREEKAKEELPSIGRCGSREGTVKGQESDYAADLSFSKTLGGLHFRQSRPISLWRGPQAHLWIACLKRCLAPLTNGARVRRKAPPRSLERIHARSPKARLSDSFLYSNGMRKEAQERRIRGCFADGKSAHDRPNNVEGWDTAVVWDASEAPTCGKLSILYFPGTVSYAVLLVVGESIH